MKRFLFSTFILLSLAGICALAPIAGFQTESAYAQGEGTGAAAMDMEVHAKAMEAEPDPNFGCIGGEGSMLEGCGTAAMYYIMKACAWIAVWTSVIFNYVVLELLVNMGKLVGNIPGITDAWEVVRDLVNVFLVFITVYIGISMIVGASSFGSKKMLGRVILAALLVNFSSTVAKLVIDVSNVAAIHGYAMLLDQAKSGQVKKSNCAEPSSDNLEPKGNTCITTGIAGVFWSHLRMTQIFNIKDFQKKGAAEGDTPKQTDDALMWVGLLGAIMFLVLAFVMGAMAFMLIARFLILVMCIIFSPLAFVSLITGISGKGKEWWSMLTKQAIVAPVMFLMLWISFRMIDGLSKRLGLGEGSKGGVANSAIADVGAMGILTYFLIIIGSLIMSLIVAQDLGAKGASAAISYGKRASKAATIGLGMYAGRKGWQASKATGRLTRDYTYGWGMNKWAKSQEAAIANAHKTNEDGTYAHTGVRARLMRASTKLGFNRAAQGALNSQAAGYRKRKEATKAYMDSLGKESKYQEVRRNAQIVGADQGKDENQLNEEARAMVTNMESSWNNLETNERARLRASGISPDAANEQAKEYIKKLQDTRKLRNIQEWRTAEELQAAERKYVDQVKEARASMGKIGTEEMTRMRNENPEELAKVAEHLSSEQIKTMEDTATYGNKKHAQSNTRVKATRRDATERTFKPAGGAAIDMRAARKSVKRMSESEHKDFVKTIEDLARTLPALRTAGGSAYTKARDELQARISAMQPKDIVKLEDRTIMSVEVLPLLDSRHLRALDVEGKLEGPDRETIYQYSVAVPAGAPPHPVTLTDNAKEFFKTDQGKMWR